MTDAQWEPEITATHRNGKSNIWSLAATQLLLLSALNRQNNPTQSSSVPSVFRLVNRVLESRNVRTAKCLRWLRGPSQRHPTYRWGPGEELSWLRRWGKLIASQGDKGPVTLIPCILYSQPRRTKFISLCEEKVADLAEEKNNTNLSTLGNLGKEKNPQII